MDSHCESQTTVNSTELKRWRSSPFVQTLNAPLESLSGIHIENFLYHFPFTCLLFERELFNHHNPKFATGEKEWIKLLIINCNSNNNNNCYWHWVSVCGHYHWINIAAKYTWLFTIKLVIPTNCLHVGVATFRFNISEIVIVTFSFRILIFINETSKWMHFIEIGNIFPFAILNMMSKVLAHSVENLFL